MSLALGKLSCLHLYLKDLPGRLNLFLLPIAPCRGGPGYALTHKKTTKQTVISPIADGGLWLGLKFSPFHVLNMFQGEE